MKDLGHGANVEQIARMYNKNPKDIIDFSSNINPNVIQGLEEYILEGLQESRSYPDIKYTNLRNNISQYIDVRPEFIIPGNGATEIIYLLMKSIDKRIAILNPTFSEYERSARLNNLDVINLNLDESNEFEIDLNNIKENINKFDSLFGLTSNNDIIEKIYNYKEPWTINSFADTLSNYIFKDQKYIEDSKEYYIDERNFMLSELKSINSIHVYDTDTNFILIRLNDKRAKEIKVELLREGNILIRDASNFIGLDDRYIRIAIKSHKENELLIRHMKKLLGD